MCCDDDAAASRAAHNTSEVDTEYSGGGIHQTLAEI